MTNQLVKANNTAMQPRRVLRRMLATALPAVLLFGANSGSSLADPLYARNMSSYGMPGGVDTPTAENLVDGTLGATVSYSNYARRNALIFQALPDLTAALRYSRIEGIDEKRGFIWDRSFDFRYRVFDESGWRPAVAVGLQDFLGTGQYSGEYVVASKNLTPSLRASLGLGWGRIAGDPRPQDKGDTGGKPNVKDWFTGDTRPFGSVSWKVNDALTLVAEYSSDRYAREVAQGVDEPLTNFNFGASYKFKKSYEFGLYSIGGESIGVQFSLALNPKEAPFPSGLESAPAPVRPRPAPAADPEGWSGVWSQDPTAQPAIQKALGDALANEGQILESMALSATRAEVRIRNTRYIRQAEAIGRTARLMTRALPPSVETFVITSSEDGVPTSSVTLRRSDVERLENTKAGDIASAAVINDAVPYPDDLIHTPDLFPRFRWKLSPYLQTSLFDPDDPLKYEVGGQVRASYEISPGFIVSGVVRQRVFGTIKRQAPDEDIDIEEYDALDYDYNDSGIPYVRSDGNLYAGNKHPTIPNLTLAWYARPSKQIYTRVTLGWLERAYAGASAEVLWKPVASPLALGVEVNSVRKRDFDGLLGLRSYEATTGHVSAYYEFGGGVSAQLDVGKYLAGDHGATITVAREFANGWRVGAFATKTDMSEEDFGEGSFDKGISLSIPVGWATGQPTADRAGGTLRSLSRDGGTKVGVPNRLYDTIRNSHSNKLYEGWGGFWR